MSVVEKFGNHCYVLSVMNFTEDGFDAYKLDRQEYMTNFFAFGLPWLKIIICLFGVLTNLLNIVVLSRPHISSSINIQFIALEVVNLLLYTTFFYEFAFFYNKEYVILFSEEISLISTVSYCLHNVCVCVSNWLTVSVGIWRLAAITYPFKAPIYCSKYRSKLVVGGIVCLALSLWCYYFFSFECLLYVYDITKKDDSVSPVYVRLTGNWRSADDSFSFKLHYPIAVLLSTAVPCSVLIVVTLCLIARLWKAKHERNAVRIETQKATKSDVTVSHDSGETRLTATLTAMIVMYFVIYLPDSVNSILYWFFDQSYIQTLLICRIAWSRCGILLGNSLTIFFYTVMSKRLRSVYVSVLRVMFCCGAKTTLKTEFDSTVVSQTSIL